MSIIIKGMQLPNNCSCCPCCYPIDDSRMATLEDGSFFCSASEEAYDIQNKYLHGSVRPEYCPMIKINIE